MDELVLLAREVRERAYAPYSSYLVGAALRDERGKTFVGVNVENVSYGATICAERAAILAMATDGGRRIAEMAVVTRDGGPPCGMCLQVLSEFADGDMRICLVNESGEASEFRLADFIPRPFASPTVVRADGGPLSP